MHHFLKYNHLIVLSFFLASFRLAMAQSAINNPVKLVLVAETQTIRSGEAATLGCILIDKDNKRITSPRNLAVAMTAKSPAGRLSQTNFVIKAGESSVEATMLLRDLGATEISAKCGGLLSRGTFVMVKADGLVDSWSSHISTNAMRRVEVAAPAMRLSRTALSSHLPPANFIITPRPASPVTSSVKPLGLILKTRTEQHLADGADAVSIMVFLDENTDVAPADITIELFNRSGTLTPKPLVIRKGLSGVEAQLTSDRVGDVVVEYRKSMPHAILQGPTSITNRFGPPITTLHVRPDYASISLLGKCNLFVECLDKNQKQIATDVDRQVTLSLDSGSGIIASNVVVIPTGRAQAQTSFSPTRLGTTRIHASTLDLFESTVDLRVTLPILLLALSLLGGFVGGGISAFSEKPKTKSALRRAGIGVITGFILYWACIFLNSYIKMPAEVALNPFSGFALSTVGGFAGTKIFSMVLKHL